MIMKKINNKFYKILGITLLIFLSGCQISPGIYLEPQSSWVDKKEYVYIPALEENIFIKDISSNLGFDNLAKYELRNDLTIQLAEYFNNPQIDISILEYKSRKVFILGEVMRPQRINLTDVPLSLADAIGMVNGLNNNTSDSSEIYLMRQPTENVQPEIYRANLSDPAGILNASNFYLADNDVVYVNAKGTTRWNKVVSQFFPFSSFLNSVDRLIESD